MKMKILFGCTFLALLTLCTQDGFAQKPERPTYQTAIGVKGFPFGVDFKTFVGRRGRAIELIGYFSDGFRLTGLYEFHGKLNAPGNIKWYLGFGAHGGYYEKGEEEGISAGFDGVIGLDYKFPRMPLNLALDWQPSFETVTPKTEFEAGRGGLAIRFAF
jgi:hypothetical protein